MRISRLLFAALLAFGMCLLRPAGASAEGAVRQMRIDASTAQVLIGEARLSVEALGRDDGGHLSGAYKVEVSPVAIGNESGQLAVNLSAADLQKLADGQPIQFTGQADSADGNHSEVRGTATPSGKGDTGALRIHIASKKGKLVFHTTYHLVR